MPKAPPREHPKPFRSLVRQHIEAILSMRRHKRMSWAEIARQLKAEHGVAVHRSTVFRVYKRARDGREPFGLGAAAERAARQSQKAAVPASAAEPSNFSKQKNITDKGYANRGITAEELLKPLPRANTGPFAKWRKQQTQQGKKKE
jgi:hypothetical protein